MHPKTIGKYISSIFFTIFRVLKVNTFYLLFILLLQYYFKGKDHAQVKNNQKIKRVLLSKSKLNKIL